MRSTFFFCAVLIIISCNHREAQEDYSKVFFETFSKGTIKLQHDSLIFPIESGMNEPVLIPTILTLNKKNIFLSQSGLTLLLTRINYTDIDYELWNESLIEKGKASLQPLFYLGVESIETSEGGFWVTDYYVESSAYLNTIRVGNEGLLNKKITDVYVYIIPNSGSKLEEDVGMRELWRLKN